MAKGMVKALFFAQKIIDRHQGSVIFGGVTWSPTCFHGRGLDRCTIQPRDSRVQESGKRWNSRCWGPLVQLEGCITCPLCLCSFRTSFYDYDVTSDDAWPVRSISPTSSFGRRRVQEAQHVSRPVNPPRGLGEYVDPGQESVSTCDWSDGGLELEEASGASDSRFQWTWTVRFQMPHFRRDKMALHLVKVTCCWWNKSG